MRFYIVDAFTEELFGGNPAGVVLLDEGEDFPQKDIMRKTAAELRYSETAFIKQLDADRFHVRYFTPTDEVDLCGHATIGSFAALSESGVVDSDCDLTAETLAGQLTIKLQHGFVMMQMAEPQYLRTLREPQELSELYSVMGLPYEDLIVPQSCSTYVRLFPMIISTGLPDIILPVKSQQALSAITPDFPALAALSEKYQVTGIHAFTLDRADFSVTAHCRNFAPLYGIDEEAATGTASGALTYYLFSHNLIADESECTFIQGEAMERPSRILTHVRRQTPDNPPLIHVGGSAKILASGTIQL